MKIKALLAAALVLSTSAWAESWSVNKSGFAIKQSDTTMEYMGVNECANMLMFAAPAADNVVDGTTGTVNPTMRIDTKEPWQGTLNVSVNDRIVIVMASVKPGLIAELKSGQTLRIKWADGVITRYDLAGLTAILKTITCDQEYFEKDKSNSDADYFL